MHSADAIVIGGGLAGLSAAIGLAKRGHGVIVFERHSYPRHKVCGEYLSNQALPFLQSLGIELDAQEISRLTIFAHDGNSVQCDLPLGGIGVSRYLLDEMLYRKAIETGCTVIFDEVTGVQFANETYLVATRSGESHTAPLVLGAYGKTSVVDKSLRRKFAPENPQWLAIKAHYDAHIDRDLVGLYLFPGGYCGVSAIEDGKVNICYLASYKRFTKFKSPDDFTANVVGMNPALNKLLASARPEFEKPLAISNLLFQKKSRVENHILMLGDSAQMIHPLSGNGMAMALGSAQICIPLADRFLQGKISRAQLEYQYDKFWKSEYSGRLRVGAILSKVMLSPLLSALGLRLLKIFPWLLPMLVTQTHGRAKPRFDVRSSLPEIMDDFEMEGPELEDALNKIATINQFLGGNRVTLRGVESFVRPNMTHLKIVDFGCGNGDMLRELAKWGRRRKLKLELIGVDANAFTISQARAQSAGFAEIDYACLDITGEAAASIDCDIALFTLTLHHFPDEDLVRILGRAKRNSRLGVVVNDLHRSPVAYRLFKLICRIFGLNRMSREDGLVSILRGFKKHDLERYAKLLNIGKPEINWKWAFRYRWIIRKV